MNDRVKIVGNIRSLLKELRSGSTEIPDIGTFEALERELSLAVDELHAERFETSIRSVFERTQTLESLEKVNHDVQEILREVTGKKRAEINSKRLWNLLNRAGDCILTVDAQSGRILDVNETVVRELGYTQEEILRLPLKDIAESLPLASAESWRAWLEAIKAGGDVSLIEGAFRHQNGDRLPMELSISLRAHEDQDYLVIVARDIKRQKQAESGAQRQLSFLGQILDSDTDGVLAFDRRSALTFCNSSLGRLLGVEKREILGKNVLEAIPLLKELGEDQHIRETLAGRSTTSSNRCYTIPGSDRQVVFDGHYSPLFDESSQEVMGGIAVIRDVSRHQEIELAVRKELESRMRELTEGHREAQQKLEAKVSELEEEKEVIRESGEKMRTLVKNLPDYVLTVADDGRILSVNRTWQGLAEEEINGADFYRFIRSEYHDTVRSALERVFRTGEGDQLDIGTPNGRMFETRFSPLIRDDAVAAGLIMATEITDRRKAEDEELKRRVWTQQAQNMESLALLAGGAARDYDEQLSDMLGQVGSVREELPPDSSARYSIEQIESAALRATELTDQLLAYSGRGKPGDRPVNLGGLVQEITQSLRTSVSPGTVLRNLSFGQTPLIKADESQIRQLISSLVSNASEALNGQEGVITLVTGTVEASGSYLSESYLGEGLPEGQYVFLEVSDTGRGMDEVTKANLFVPFFTTKSNRRGLGLATVVGTVRSHHGAIRVKTTSEQGVTILVLFPRPETSGEKPVEELGPGAAK